MTEILDSSQVAKNYVTLQMGLRALKNIEGKKEPDAFKRQLRISLGSLLWEALPKQVTELDLGEGVTIARDQKTVAFIASKDRETWPLFQVDAYGARMAKTIQRKWEPMFLPPEQVPEST